MPKLNRPRFPVEMFPMLEIEMNDMMACKRKTENNFDMKLSTNNNNWVGFVDAIFIAMTYFISRIK